MRIDMSKLLEIMTPEQREKLYPKGYPMNGKYPQEGCVMYDTRDRVHTYELGINVDGVREVVWRSTQYPPTGMHDMMSNVVNALVKRLPNSRISWYNECDGQEYSY